MFDSDQQASEFLSDWFKENKYYLLAFFIVLFGGYFLTSLWLESKDKKLMNASVEFSKLIDLIKLNNNQDIEAQIDVLINQFPNSPYSDLSAIVRSKLNINENKADSIDSLNYIIKNSKQSIMIDIARLRLIRIYLDMNNVKLADEQYSLLTEFSQKTILANLLLGDIAFLKSDYGAAIVAYRKSLDLIPDKDENMDYKELQAFVLAKISDSVRNSKL